jgi:hypothetical protein
MKVYRVCLPEVVTPLFTDKKVNTPEVNDEVPAVVP